LAAYALDRSEVDPALAAHIASCAVCQPEVAWFDEVVEDLERYPGCPSVDAVTRYALGESPEDEQLVVAAHLRTCSACAEEVDISRTVFSAEAPEEAGLFAAIRRIVARLDPGVALAQRDAPDALGALAEPQSRSYQAGDFRVQLGAEREGETYILTGVITAGASAATAPGIENEALLFSLEEADDGQRPRVVARAHVENRSFDFDGVPAGSYRLEALLGETLIVFESITVP
jgi:hypothetical protein